LEQITDLPELAKIISNRLVKTLQLEDSIIFLRNLDGDLSVIEVAPTPKVSEKSRMDLTTLPKKSLTYLLNIGAMGRNSLRQALSEAKLSSEELQLLNSDQVYLWVPVISHGQVLGLLALGAKLGGDIFSGEDMDILRIVAQQMAPLIENIHLVTRLRQHAAELEQRVEERTAELHASKERVEAVLSSVGDGVFVTDLNGKILTVNRAFEDQSGFTAKEIVGQQMFTMLDSQENLENEAEIRSALESKYNWSGELMARRKGGRLYDIQLTIAPVRNQEGEIMGYVGSQRDITQSKELERLKDQFILEVSHELRTPVTNMGLYAELLERGKPEKKGEYLSILRSEINQLMRMIEDILDLSRLEIGKYKKATFSMVDINLLADQVVAAHAPLAEESGLDLVFLPGENLPRIGGEQNQLARVLTNLLANAIRYTPAGSVLVKTYVDRGGLCVEVKDTGIGIDPEDIPHLYERFYRGKEVSQSKIIGSGLGLAIVKEIVELHDGQIQCETAVGQGTTFRVWLPAPQIEVLSGWGVDIISRR
jgi:two-component system phosphate regulon sensor histidine kinase PhoR